MSATNSPKTFSFGKNNIGEKCECPALSAGYHPVDSDLVGMDSIVGRYDTILRNQKNQPNGEVSEEEAKGAWIQALKELEESKYIEVEAAETVAEYHDWI